MEAPAGARTDGRVPLTRERVLRAAVGLADRGGIEALSMRRLGQDLGVEAMALYRHVRSKDDILDGVVDAIVGEIQVPARDADWRTVLRGQVMAARAVMLRHPWAPRLLEERTAMGPAMLGYLDSVLALLLEGGFSLELAHHGLHTMGSRVIGFSQDIFDNAQKAEPVPAASTAIARSLADHYPHLAELALAASHDGGLGECDDDVEFVFALDLLLDGLERLRAGD